MYVLSNFLRPLKSRIFSTIGCYDKVDVEINKNSKIKTNLKFTYDRKEERLLFNNGKISINKKAV